MRETMDRDALLRVSSIFDLLDIGWRPGDAELETARYVENWAILPSSEGIPFRMMGIAWSLPIRRTVMVAGVLVIDRTAGWARIWDEWVVIGHPIDDMPIDTDAIQRAGAAWLLTELRRWPPVA